MFKKIIDFFTTKTNTVRDKKMKTILLISGFKGSGKDFAGDFIKKELIKDGLIVEIDKFALELKDLTKKSFQPLVELFDDFRAEFIQLMNDTQMPIGKRSQFESLLAKLKIEDRNFYEDKTEITRILLQVVGTDVAHYIDNGFWGANLARKIDKSDADVFIITDTRFPKEIELFEEFEFYDQVNLVTLRINPSERKIDKADSHISENALNDYPFQYTVTNNFDESFEKNLALILEDMRVNF